MCSYDVTLVAGTIDLLTAMDIAEAAKNEGVDEVDGFCDSRPDSNFRADLAYDIDSRALLSVSTYNVFPGQHIQKPCISNEFY